MWRERERESRDRETRGYWRQRRGLRVVYQDSQDTPGTFVNKYLSNITNRQQGEWSKGSNLISISFSKFPHFLCKIQLPLLSSSFHFVVCLCLPLSGGSNYVVTSHNLRRIMCHIVSPGHGTLQQASASVIIVPFIFPSHPTTLFNFPGNRSSDCLKF